MVTTVLATWVHNLDPVALPLFGGLAVRWYGLAYLLGFVCGFLLLKQLARRGLWVLKAEQAGDFMAAAALFGVFLGGRIGYVLLYQLPEIGWSGLARDPLMIFRVWEGGMASHGGITGLLIFTWFYAKKHRVTWTGLGDGLCVVAPVGLLFGRLANFINGELYGRVAQGVPWAVIFPESLREESPEVQREIWDACTALDPGLANADSMHALVASARDHPEIARVLGEHLAPRHPSQLYEAFTEGALLLAILWWVRTRFPQAPDGLCTGLFFGLYALFRIGCEQFREPDAPMVGAITKGQFFSLFMFLFAAGFLLHAWRGHKQGGGD
jgi:phosphatidylglycerol:prolipoprotein diacylglycerol transferase